MFHLFKQKTRVRFPYTEDMHSHILPGLDDGVRTLDEAVAIVRQLLSSGVKSFVFTPHVISPYVMNTEADIRPAFASLRRALEEEYAALSAPPVDFPRLAYGAEYRMDSYLLDLIDRGELLSFSLADGSRNNVLIEHNFTGPSLCSEEILFLMQEAGYHPIMAHLERYPFYWGNPVKAAEDLKTRGCRLQANWLSFSGFYGRGVYNAAMTLYKAGLYDMVSGDWHSLDYVREYLRYRDANV